MGAFDMGAFAQTPLTRDPFDFLVVPGFLSDEALALACQDFPAIAHAGLTPLSELAYGPGFAAVVDELRSGEMEEAFSEKFGVDLSRKPLMITVRSRSQQKDGRIHVDSESKVISALLYLNEPWREEGGRLRFLRGPDDIEDMVAEVPPDAGTLAAFRRSDRSYHGHKPFVGPRRYIMFNWMTDELAMTRELARHRLSARVKRFLDTI